MVHVSFDMREVDTYVASLRAVPAELTRHLVPVMKRGAQNVKEALQGDYDGSGNAAIRAIRNKISYDEPTLSGGVIETAIGIDKGGAGNLGGVATFGTWKGGGTHLHPSYYAQKEVEGLEQHLGAAAAELIR